MSTTPLLKQQQQAYRAVERLPPEAEAGVAVALQLLPLAAAVVAVEHEAPLVIALHEYHTVGGAALGTGSGYAHGIGLSNALTSHCILEPAQTYCNTAPVA